MPFQSKAQQRYLYAKEPAVAKEFASHMDKADYKNLPEHAGDKSSAMKKVLNKYQGGSYGNGTR